MNTRHPQPPIAGQPITSEYLHALDASHRAAVAQPDPLLAADPSGTVKRIPPLKFAPQAKRIGFTGMVFIKGRAIDLTAATSKDWVRCMLDTVTAEYNDGPPPIPFPPFEVWYRTSYTYGDIVIPQ